MSEPVDVPAAPWFRVVAGDPTAEELAALAVVLASRPSVAAPPPTRTNGWSAYWRSLQAPLTPGPSAWRNSERL